MMAQSVIQMAQLDKLTNQDHQCQLPQWQMALYFGMTDLLEKCHQEVLSRYLAGVSGLSQFVFGREQTVTQPFSNYNPEMGYASGMHQGVDYRTRDYQG